MPVSLQPVALPAAVLIAICLVLAGNAIAESGAQIKEVTIPAQYPMSGSAQLSISEKTGVTAPAGSVQIVRTDRTAYLFVPANIVNGGRLTEINDQDAGIFFKNNTIILPVKEGQSHDVTLVVATEDMTSGPGGFLGRITGAELDIPGEEIVIDGNNFSAGASIFLKDLLPGTAYRISSGRGTEETDTINAGLSPSGLSALEVPLAVEVYGADPQSGSAIEFMIITLNADTGWVQKYGRQNISFHLCRNGTAFPQPCMVLKEKEGKIGYQAVLPGTGTFVLSATGDSAGNNIATGLSDIVDALVLGGLLAVLVSALIVMLRRVAKKR